MRRISIANAQSKIIMAKDPKHNADEKLGKLIVLMKKFGFKMKQKNRNQQFQPHGLIECSLTIFGQSANVVVTRNSGAFGSNSPLKVLIYIPAYDGMCGDWGDYFKGVTKINQFICQVQKIDQDLLK